jgi:hypothetical protein
MRTKQSIARSTLTPAERAELAFDVYRRLYDGTESFGHIGSDVAYLLGAILSPHAEFVLWNESDGRDILKVLRREFPLEHQVWSFIKMEADSRPIVRPPARSKKS